MMTLTEENSLPELQIGQYNFLRLLGHGNFAEVWEARHRHLAKGRLAIKFLLPEFAQYRDLQDRFLKEAWRQTELRHVNIAPTMDLFQIAGRAYVVMHYIGGEASDSLPESLHGRLQELLYPLGADEIRTISADVLSALQYAHSRGIFHGDVKPANILRGANGNAVLTDFGIARAFLPKSTGPDPHRSVSSLSSSFDFTSPEQLENPAAVDARSDVYSFGCVLYSMLTGYSPFVSTQDASLEDLIRLRQTSPQSVAYLDPQIPQAVGEVALKCLARNPAHRFQNCDEVLEALNAATDPLISMPVDEPAPAPIPVSVSQEPKPLPIHLVPAPVVVGAPIVPASQPEIITPSFRAAILQNDSEPEETSGASSGMWKYLLVGVAAILLIGVLVLSFSHRTPSSAAAAPPSSSSSMLAVDWSRIRYDDPRLSDCKDVAPCSARSAQAASLAAVHDWKRIFFDNPMLQDCMGDQPCLDRKAQADKLVGWKDWVHPGDGLLADCMGYGPCLNARSRPAETAHAAPGSESVRPHSAAPAHARQSLDPEDLPSCCRAAANPKACRALKLRESIPDCSSPIGID